ncbi:MAG: proline--tRNA ligase [Candidatus Kapaibacteriales bacterium]
MRLSQYFVPTLKDIDSNVQIPSHKLMLKAGLVRQLAAGVFSWLPIGLRVLKKIEKVVREEMDAIGGQEFLLPGLNPKEIWEETNRVEAMGDVLFHVKNNDQLVLAPTHEEVITYHARHSISSYKEMPQIWYQIQTKYRNEARPKSGVLRGRQFIMKDSYSLDSSWDGLDVSYEKHKSAYQNIFDRFGLEYFIVGASSGAMGGAGSQEFMVPSEHGEDLCVYSDSGYAANIEVATSKVDMTERIEEKEIEEFATPNEKTINDLVSSFGLDERYCIKTLVYISNDEPVLILMRGNDELNESKLEKALGTDKFRPAEDNELVKITGANAGSIGPVGLKDIKIVSDLLLEDRNGLYCGANRNGYHIKNVSMTQDVKNVEFVDLRTVREGELDPENGEPLIVTNAIELGHIFKLGTRYSDSMGAKFLDNNGREQSIIMGSYGIGMERIMACFIEQNHDDKGIVWNSSTTPFDVHIIGIGVEKNQEVSEKCEEIYSHLTNAGVEVLYDDRKASPGYKFADANLIGIPVQIIVGAKTLKEGKIEVVDRKSGEKQLLEIDTFNQYLDSIKQAKAV